MLCEIAAEWTIQRIYQDDTVSIFQRFNDVICVCLCYLTFHLVLGGGCYRSSAAKENVCERTIHGNALQIINTQVGYANRKDTHHDVGQNRTTHANQ